MFAGINLIPTSVVSGRYLPEFLNQVEMVICWRLSVQIKNTILFPIMFFVETVAGAGLTSCFGLLPGLIVAP